MFPRVGLALAVFVEVLGGLALIAGYRTRIVAAALAVFCVTAAFMFHFNLTDQNQFIHFLKNIAVTGGLVQVLVAGVSASMRADIDQSR